MKSITHSQRYLPHTIETRFYAVKLYRSGNSVQFVCRRYHISKASLMRWNKRFDGTRDSLRDKSHRPVSPHPNAHTELELKWIKDLHRRNPHISMCEMYGKLRSQKGYARHPGSLYRIYRSLGFTSKAPSTKKKRKPLKYDTPKALGIKWQMDVKYVPRSCYVGKVPEKFYQYTMIDEASRERFIYPYVEISSYSTIDFVKRAITTTPAVTGEDKKRSVTGLPTPANAVLGTAYTATVKADIYDDQGNFVSSTSMDITSVDKVGAATVELGNGIVNQLKNGYKIKARVVVKGAGNYIGSAQSPVVTGTATVSEGGATSLTWK